MRIARRGQDHRRRCGRAPPRRPLPDRDEIKTGLGLSSAAVAEDGTLRYAPDFHVAGGPVSRRAETTMVDTARLFASAGVSFVVESSVLSPRLLDTLAGAGARVLAVHVSATEAAIGDRLIARTAAGSPVDCQLLTAFQRGDMHPSIFEPPPGAHAVVDLDTTHHPTPPLGPVETAIRALLRAGADS